MIELLFELLAAALLIGAEIVALCVVSIEEWARARGRKHRDKKEKRWKI